MNLEFDGRIVIVTGGGAGIGGAISLRLAMVGAIPVIFDRSPLTPEFRVRLLERQPGAQCSSAGCVACSCRRSGICLVAAGRDDVGLRILAPGQSLAVTHRFDHEPRAIGVIAVRPA